MKRIRRILLMSTTIASLAFVLTELINSNHLNAQEKYPNLEKTNNLNFSKNNRPSLVGQLVTYEYNCQISVEQANTAPPTVNYRASLSCTAGIPVSFVLSLYNANVNFPENRRYIGPNNFTCPLTSSCSTPTYSRVIDRTQHLIVSAGVNIRGIDGLIYTVSSAGYTWRTYNNKGVGYPLIKPTRTDMAVVPFPGPPFVDHIPRDADFRAGLTQIYTANRWTIPTDAQAHHIKPIAWEGSNDPQTNGVFLGPATHTLFTTWWASFSNLSW
jgi:hypothetical protein